MASRFFTLGCVTFAAFVAATNGCTPPFSQPCQSVTCPYGQTCQSDISYYCDNIIGGFCKAVAVCTRDGTVPNPCKGYNGCPSGTTCVRVPNSCKDNTPCTFKRQCNANVRPGSCRRSTKSSLPQVTSCSNSCENDHFCEIGAKCCFVNYLNRSYCLT
ncbi:hypothetical protein BV898_02554 [Hypsibius exemplaris]|uniref:WAP domain-containing protein n=1 Tax=Hypsibius exemplaris TaxID=2072580 RepID=A0A1W0X7Z1_HYPEX|nr:hypothetical protein BV898_02554 [Hypsibius exemplaris]